MLHPKTSSVILLMFLSTHLGCDPRKAVGALQTAFPDIDARSIAEGLLCDQYIERATNFAELQWERDYPKVKPVIEAAANDPAQFWERCLEYGNSIGVRFITKPGGDGSAQALPIGEQLVVAWPHDIESRPVHIKAALCGHEVLAHSSWQKAVGWRQAALDYVTISGRLGAEGVGYGLQAWLWTQFGMPVEEAEAKLIRRAQGFPERYALGRVLTPQCTEKFFLGVFREFAKRVQ